MNTPSEANDIMAALGRALTSFNDAAISGAPLDLELLAAIGAAALNPSDSYASDTVSTRLESYRALSKLFPQPWEVSPIPGSLDGPYRIGSSMQLSGDSVGLKKTHLPGVLVLGRTGSGKSTLFYSLIDSLLDDPQVRVNYFTKKPEDAGLMLMPGRHFNWIPFGCPLNYLEPNGLPLNRLPSFLATLLGHALNFWSGSQGLLAGAIEGLLKDQGAFEGKTNFPTIRDLLTSLYKFKPRERRLMDQLGGLREKLEDLARALGDGGSYSRGLSLPSVEGENKIFFTPTDIPPGIARFHVLYLHAWQFERRRLLSPEALAREPFVVNIFDDATNFFHIDLERQGAKEGNLPPLFDLMTMQRSLRLGSVIATHAPQMLARCVADGRSATICLPLPGGEALDFVANSLSGRRLTPEQRHYITMMEPGTALLSTPETGSPAPFKVTNTVIPEFTPSEADIRMGSSWSKQSLVRTVLEPLNVPPSVVSNEDKKLLMLAHTKPGLYSSQYYRELGWSLPTGTRIRAKLLEGKLLLVHRVKSGKRGGCPELI